MVFICGFLPLHTFLFKAKECLVEVQGLFLSSKAWQRGCRCTSGPNHLLSLMRRHKLLHHVSNGGVRGSFLPGLVRAFNCVHIDRALQRYLVIHQSTM